MSKQFSRAESSILGWRRKRRLSFIYLFWRILAHVSHTIDYKLSIKLSPAEKTNLVLSADKEMNCQNRILDEKLNEYFQVDLC